VNLYVVHTELRLNVVRLARTTGLICAITGVMAVAVLLVTPLVSSLFMLGGAIAIGAITWALLAVVSGLVDPGQVRSVIS